MSFIEYKDVVIQKLSCSHPLVEKIWETGSFSEVPKIGEGAKMNRNVHLLFKDGSRKDFADSGDGQALIEAENYLQSLDK